MRPLTRLQPKVRETKLQNNFVLIDKSFLDLLAEVQIRYRKFRQGHSFIKIKNFQSKMTVCNT